eukprot:3733025-Prymnesium_polylepis.2
MGRRVLGRPSVRAPPGGPAGRVEHQHAARSGRLRARADAERRDDRVRLRVRAAVARRVRRRDAAGDRLRGVALGTERVGALRAAAARQKGTAALEVGLDRATLRQRPHLLRVRVVQCARSAAAVDELQVATRLAAPCQEPRWRRRRALCGRRPAEGGIKEEGHAGHVAHKVGVLGAHLAENVPHHRRAARGPGGDHGETALDVRAHLWHTQRRPPIRGELEGEHRAQEAAGAGEALSGAVGGNEGCKKARRA